MGYLDLINTIERPSTVLLATALNNEASSMTLLGGRSIDERP